MIDLYVSGFIRDRNKLVNFNITYSCRNISQYCLNFAGLLGLLLRSLFNLRNIFVNDFNSYPDFHRMIVIFFWPLSLWRWLNWSRNNLCC